MRHLWLLQKKTLDTDIVKKCLVVIDVWEIIIKQNHKFSNIYIYIYLNNQKANTC